jgi:UDP-3-O-[3-hydroxymyristoyl] glucosamine N-acyltransferase
MEFTASQIASFIDGKVIGDENALITGVSPIENGESGHLSFIAQDRFSTYLDSSNCSVIIVSEQLITNQSYKPTLIVVKDAYLSFQVLMNYIKK